MAHAKATDLEDIKTLLIDLRTIEFLKEKSLGCYYFKSKSVLHFHIKNERRYAHIFDGTVWLELDIPKSSSEKKLKIIYKTILNTLNYI